MRKFLIPILAGIAFIGIPLIASTPAKADFDLGVPGVISLDVPFPNIRVGSRAEPEMYAHYYYYGGGRGYYHHGGYYGYNRGYYRGHHRGYYYGGGRHHHHGYYHGGGRHHHHGYYR